jgi:hypothetical protein
MRSAPAKQFVAPRLDAARAARQWDVVRTRGRGKKTRWRWDVLVAVGSAAALVAVLFMVVAHSRFGSSLVVSSPVVEGAWLESGAEGTQVTLADGSKVRLEANSRAHLSTVRSDAVRVELERGGMAVDTKEVPGRSFVLATSGYEMRARSTLAFAIEVRAFELDVHVERGEVEIASPDGALRTLRAGETWSARAGVPAGTAPSAPSGIAAPAAATVSATTTALTAAPSAPEAPHAALVAPENAKSLFEDAQRARAEGHPMEAARLFDKLRHGYRRDPRAGLSAFELGRLRLDELGDPRGAEEALHDAIALTADSPFREDAEARRVEALARMGDHARCVAMRDAYLARYPTGAYRKTVAVYCNTP